MRPSWRAAPPARSGCRSRSTCRSTYWSEDTTQVQVGGAGGRWQVGGGQSSEAHSGIVSRVRLSSMSSPPAYCRPLMILSLLMAITLLLYAGCGDAGPAPAPTVDASESLSDLAPEAAPVGCLDWNHWQCDPPPAGQEYGCASSCGSNLLLCNRQVGECRLGHGGASYDSFAVPATGLACDICRAGVEGPARPFIE
jgi:hypothetical protein